MTPLRLVQVLVEAEKLLESCECQLPPYLDICEGDGKTTAQECRCYPLRVAVSQLHEESLGG